MQSKTVHDIDIAGPLPESSEDLITSHEVAGSISSTPNFEIFPSPQSFVRTNGQLFDGKVAHLTKEVNINTLDGALLLLEVKLFKK